MAAVHTFEQLVTFLNDNKFPYKMDPAHQVLELPSKAAPMPGNLYIKWEKTVPFLQLIQFMIENVPEARIADVLEAIARLNNKLEVGGFGFDHDRRRLYCRLTVPVFAPDGINPTTLNQIGAGVVRNAKEFVEPLRAVVEGKPGAEVEDLYRQIVRSRQGQTPSA